MPAVLPILTLPARLPLSHIPVAIPAPPIMLPVIAPTDLALGIIVIAIIATPTVLLTAAAARVSPGTVPPVGWIIAPSATLHVVSGWITMMTCGTLPVLLPVVAPLAGVLPLDLPVAVQTVPVHMGSHFF